MQLRSSSRVRCLSTFDLFLVPFRVKPFAPARSAPHRPEARQVGSQRGCDAGATMGPRVGPWGTAWDHVPALSPAGRTAGTGPPPRRCCPRRSCGSLCTCPPTRCRLSKLNPTAIAVSPRWTWCASSQRIQAQAARDRWDSPRNSYSCEFRLQLWRRPEHAACGSCAERRLESSCDAIAPPPKPSSTVCGCDVRCSARAASSTVMAM